MDFEFGKYAIQIIFDIILCDSDTTFIAIKG